MKILTPPRPARSTTPASSSTAAFSRIGPAASTVPITLRCPKASRTQSIAAASRTSSSAPFAEGTSATASKKIEGPLESA